MEIKTKEKIKRLFQFLKQYNNIKNPIITEVADQQWRMWLDNIPKHEVVVNNIYSLNGENEEILRVKRPILTDCPRIPQELLEWIEKGWENTNGKVVVKKELKVLNETSVEEKDVVDKYIIEKFEDNIVRVNLFLQWEKQRSKWVKAEVAARAADDLFNSLYGLYSNMNKEVGSLELILGDGNLLYKKEVYIDHPILLQHVKLEFDADIPEFILTVSDKGTEIYRSLLYYLEDVNNELLKGIYDDFEEINYSPLEVENTNAFLNRMINALSAKGRFAQSKELTSCNMDNPQIYRKPVLFLRKRNLGFGLAIDTIIEDINISGKIPNFLKDVVGSIDEFVCENEISLSNLNIDPKGVDEDTLLTKAANSEQLLVAKYLEKNSAVLVQGPPGTGKTHTIANMIGHLLSQGKSILVTSCSEKALSVLKDKVDPNLQSLCLSLLSTTESRGEMEKNLDEINENRSKLDPMILDEQIEILKRIRKNQINKLNELKLKLKNIRLNEHRPIVINGEEFSPISAAKYVSKHEDIYSWIPTPVKQGTYPLLTEEEIMELYQTNILISEAEERELQCKHPKLDEILNPIDFQKLLTEKDKFSQDLLKKYKECWRPNDVYYTSEDLKSLILYLNKALNMINLDNTWTMEIIEASKIEVTKQNWLNLISEINTVFEMSLNITEEIIKYNPEFKTLQDKIDLRKQLESIIDKLQADGKITRLNLMMNSDMKAAINSCRINGNIPKYLNEFKTLLKYYDLKAARRQLEQRWNRQMAVLGADNTKIMGEDFELTCKKYSSSIEENLTWYERYWNPVISRLKRLGMQLDLIDKDLDISFDKYSRLKYIKNTLGNKIIDVINSEIYRLQYNMYIDKIDDISMMLRKYTYKQSSKVVEGLLEAIFQENVDMYKANFDGLANIEYLSRILEKRQHLLKNLYEDAPAWAKEIESRNSNHGKGKPPTTIKEAWLYTQFNQELAERNKQSTEEVNRDVIKLEKAIDENTSELAFKKAWKAKIMSFQYNKKQVQAIEGWRQLIRKIGNGKGKRAEIYKAEARKLMPSCQGAIPVWIMPLSKVVENFNPNENKFDIVIIDEASQADVMALTALYLGKKVIIVGDNEQVSPLSIGEKAEDVDKLIREYLYDFPNDKLYSGKFSLYDLAQASGYQPIRLKEHFRCVPDIIQYSNMLSYNGQIKPLRDDSKVKLKPATIVYRVEGAISRNKINEKEAETIVSLILACCEHEEYKEKTFGVITLRGDKQAVLIDRILQKKMEPMEYKKRELLCGNSANFQGDERDVIFLSMVDTNEGDGPLRLNGYGNDDLYKKRYNVAVSRARDQIWLVHSLDIHNDLKPGDIRKELLSYLKNPKSRDMEYRTLSNKAESEFEREVMRSLINRGYKISPQWQVGSYRIDMVALFSDKKVAIECDGERWHGEEKFEEDMIRQSILERLGWRFIRIRGSEFYRNKIETINDVSDRLKAMEIYPCDSEIEDDILGYGNLTERIKSAAEKIRRKWQ